ncbi:peptidoglycan-binding domain-containing protein [Streptomyces sporangiiformans]|nr:peptidoglycan-binding domain-containing protein [Streptomyces sporangiiformans]
MNGDFGPLTHGAVVTLQKRAGLDADGIVGPNTWRALRTKG